MTNPLDLRGPEFLHFYIVYGAGVFLFILALRFLWHREIGRASCRERV